MVRAERIEIANGGSIGAATSAVGDAADVVIATDDLSIVGNFGQSFTGITSQVLPAATGSAGEVEVVARKTLAISDLGQITATTFGEGSGGAVTIIAEDLTMSRGGIVASTTSLPPPGLITPR